MEDDLKISKVEYLSIQQPLIGLASNFKLKLGGPNQNQLTLKQRQPPMEDDLKILKVEYLINHRSDFSQISNLSSGDQTKIKNTQNEDNLQQKTTSNGRRPENIKT